MLLVDVWCTNLSSNDVDVVHIWYTVSMSNDVHTTPRLIAAFTNSDTAPVNIRFEGYAPLRTARRYRYLVVSFSTATQKWSKAKQDYVPCEPQVRIVNGTNDWNVATRSCRRTANGVVLVQNTDGRTWSVK